MLAGVVGFIDEDDIELEGILAEIGEISFAGVALQTAMALGEATSLRIGFLLQITAHKLLLVCFLIENAITLELYKIEEFDGEYRVFAVVDFI